MKKLLLTLLLSSAGATYAMEAPLGDSLESQYNTKALVDVEDLESPTNQQSTSASDIEKATAFAAGAKLSGEDELKLSWQFFAPLDEEEDSGEGVGYLEDGDQDKDEANLDKNELDDKDLKENNEPNEHEGSSRNIPKKGTSWDATFPCSIY